MPSGVNLAFINGNAEIDSTTARMKKGSSVSLYPVSRSKRSFSRARHFHAVVTSMETIDHACGAVCFDSTMRSAMMRRACVSGIVVPGIGLEYDDGPDAKLGGGVAPKFVPVAIA